MSEYYIENPDGTIRSAANLDEWARTFDRANKWHIRETHGNADVSTVFLGLDHRFDETKGRPILYETMVFGGEYDQEQERYCTRAEAIEGHARWVTKVKESQ